jgi:hypothetical protein
MKTFASMRTEVEQAYRMDYFFQIHNEMMKRQLQRHLNKIVGEEDAEDIKDVGPVIEHGRDCSTLSYRRSKGLCHLRSPLDKRFRLASRGRLPPSRTNHQRFHCTLF